VEQEKLEERVRHIFKGNRFKAQGEQTEVSGTLFSSQRFEKEEVVEAAEGRVFVDEGLSSVADTLDDVSVLENQERGDIDMPSFEVIGDIAVINQLEMPEDEAVDAILSHHDVKTILLKTEPLQGEFRVGEYKKLYGDETETIHRENGCRFKVDVTEAYFSERLATERQRVVEKIEEDEDVLVIGAGVGPYPIEIARNAEPARVVAVEKNPEAFRLLNQNIGLNGVGDVIEPVVDDIRNMEAQKGFDRVLMAAPEASGDLSNHTVDFVGDGGRLYLYTFSRSLPNDDTYNELGQVLQTRECGERGPKSSRYLVEIKPLSLSQNGK
jgi:tRNA (guanine37-N1)-methyltransferase